MVRTARERCVGERERVEHQIKNVRGILEALEIALRAETQPVGAEPGEALMHAAGTLAVTLARADAYLRVANDLEWVP